jgi:uncharacterized protein (DUF983 family)
MPVLRIGGRLYAAPRTGTQLCCPRCGNGEVALLIVTGATAPSATDGQVTAEPGAER